MKENEKKKKKKFSGTNQSKCTQMRRTTNLSKKIILSSQCCSVIFKIVSQESLSFPKHELNDHYVEIILASKGLLNQMIAISPLILKSMILKILLK